QRLFSEKPQPSGAGEMTNHTTHQQASTKLARRFRAPALARNRRASHKTHVWELRLCWIALSAVLGAVLGCQGQVAGPQSDAHKGLEQSKPAVVAVKPVQRSFRHKIEVPGEIQAFEQTPMYAKISGYVSKVN